jgi:hypothetical protein
MGRVILHKKKTGSDDAKLARMIVIAAVIINFLLLIPLFQGWCLVSGDGTAHYSSAQQMLQRIEAGKGVFGSWNDSWAMGFPGYDYYQYFGHLLLVIIHFLSFKLLPIFVIEKLLVIVSVAFFPLSLYYGLRKLKLAPLPAAFASLFSFALSSSVGHGDLGFSLVNHGIFTQLMAVFIFPLALARVYISLSEKRSYFLSVLLVSIVLLIHPIVGYALCISCAIFLFDKESRSSWKKFLGGILGFVFIFLMVFIVAAHFYVPFTLVSGYYGETSWVTSSADYYRSNAVQVLFDLFSGRTLDYFRWPFALMTVFFFIGAYKALSRKDDGFPLYLVFTGFLVFLLISFGSSFWGGLFNIIPGMKYMLVFRFMFALQFFMLFFVGYGVAALFGFLRGYALSLKRVGVGSLLALGIFVLFIASPVFVQVALSNSKLCGIANEGFDSDDFMKLVLFLAKSPDGRFIARPELGFLMPYYESLLPLYTGRPSFSTSSMGSQESLSYYYTQYFMLPNHDYYDLYNIRYALVPSDDEVRDAFLKQAFVAGNYTVYRTDTAGYFDLVDSSTAVVHASSINSEFVRMVSVAWLNTISMERKDFVTFFSSGEDFDDEVFDTVIYESNTTLNAGSFKGFFKDRSRQDLPVCGRVLAENRSLDYYSASFEVNRSCYLLLKVSYHPGWSAFVDGGFTEVYAVSPSFMAVRLEAGDTSAEFIFSQDDSLRNWLMLFAVLVLVGLILYDFGLGPVKKS